MEQMKLKERSGLLKSVTISRGNWGEGAKGGVPTNYAHLGMP